MIDDQLKGKCTRNWPALFSAAMIALTGCQVRAPEAQGKAMTTSELRTYARAWFTSPTCSRPCWDGLLPGTSTIEDAYAAAARNSSTERTWTDPPGEWAWKFRGDPITIVVDYALSGRSTISQTAVALEYGYRPVSDAAHPGEWRFMRFERLRPVDPTGSFQRKASFAKANFLAIRWVDLPKDRARASKGDTAPHQSQPACGFFACMRKMISSTALFLST